jgi:uncharacterized protein (DUF362 family)
MNASLSRRDFLHRSVWAGLAAVAGPSLLTRALAAAPPEPVPPGPAGSPADLGLATQDDGFEAALASLALLGGIERFVKSGARVGVVINAPRWWTRTGSFTSPDVSLAVVKRCAEAGAREIVTIQEPRGGYWERSTHAAACRKELALVKPDPDNFVEVGIPRGLALKKAEVRRTLLDCDVIIDLPIVKHHAGTGFTACLKNMMGACSGSTNRFFHNGSGASEEYGDVAFLSQCIADLNLVRKPDLNVCDATQYLVTNGPAGPGELKRSRSVVAGTDCVAVDAYCAATFLKLRPERVAMIQKAFEHGIGQIDWNRLAVRVHGA